MKIIPDEPFRFLETYLIRNREGSRKSPVKAKPEVRVVPDSDRVEISEMARELQGLTQMVPATPDVNMERVREVQGQIASGRFQIRADQAAEGLIRSALMDQVL
jgi:flagellar biosynthesis anti-sigma factor FlgM